MLVKCVLLLLCYHLTLGGAVSEFTPTVYTAQILSFSKCGHHNSLHDEQLRQALQPVKQHISNQHTPSNHSSCKSILENCPSAPSGYYNINSTNGSAVQVYCDMEGTHCGGEGGWTRVTYVNMTQAGTTCPQGLEQMSYNGSPYCGQFSSGVGCSSALLNTTISYRQVCGRVAGYQYYATDGFYSSNASIDGAFFDGLSIMYGSPHRHIWTYAAGFGDFLNQYPVYCPCNSGSTFPVPSFVSNDYYCESGTGVNACNIPNQLYSNDVLWDGQQCGGIEGPCCTHPNMPWFIKTFSETTTEDIELRVCRQHFGCYGSVPIFLIEIYVCSGAYRAGFAGSISSWYAK